MLLFANNFYYLLQAPRMLLWACTLASVPCLPEGRATVSEGCLKGILVLLAYQKAMEMRKKVRLAANSRYLSFWL